MTAVPTWLATASPKSGLNMLIVEGQRTLDSLPAPSTPKRGDTLAALMSLATNVSPQTLKTVIVWEEHVRLFLTHRASEHAGSFDTSGVPPQDVSELRAHLEKRLDALRQLHRML